MKKFSRCFWSIICVILIVASSAIGVSAKDNIAPLDWGFGFASATTTTTTVNDYQFYNSAVSVFDGNVTRLVSSAVGFTLDSGYTYTYTATYHVSPSIPASTSMYSTVFQVPLDKQLIVHYTYSAFSDGVKQSVSSLDTDKYLYSVSLENGGETVVVTLVINTDKSGLVPSDVYFYCPFLALYKSPSSYPALTMGNSGLTVIKDLDGSAFDKSIIDAVNAIREDNENYHSNALDLLDQIANAGSGYPTPDGSSLSEQGTAMSGAEGAVRDKSSSLASSVSTEWNQYQTSAKNAAVTLKPAAAAVNNLYTLVIDVVPDEVIALFIAIAVLFFIGWLIGRVRE